MKNETIEAIMKRQVMVLLCCAWMSGVALGDTENPQKAEQGGTAVVNTDAGNVMVNEHYSISKEVFAKYAAYAANLGVTDAALANFFKMLGQNKVDRADLDKKLREIAENYKKWSEDAKLLDSDDPKVKELLRQAREFRGGKDAQGNAIPIDFSKVDALLQQVVLLQQQHIRELQQIEERAKIALGDTENSQKIEQGGTAVANICSGSVTINNHYGISKEAFAKYAADLNVTDTVLANFFKMLEQNKVDPADLDNKLHETAESYKKLLEDVKLLEGFNNPVVNTLLQQACESIEGKDEQGNSVTIDFDKAEALLQQAYDRTRYAPQTCNPVSGQGCRGGIWIKPWWIKRSPEVVGRFQQSGSKHI